MDVVVCDFVVTVKDMSGVNTCPLERFTRWGVILKTLLMVFFAIIDNYNISLAIHAQAYASASRYSFC
jgi:hypothetical protein